MGIKWKKPPGFPKRLFLELCMYGIGLEESEVISLH